MSPGHLCVMVVDDERVIADSLSTILRSRGFSVATAYDGGMALQMAASCHPDLLISDIWMPSMSGVDLAMAMVTLVPACKVLLFSGHATDVDVKPARDAGHAFPLLTKPVHPAEMLWHIGEILGVGLGGMPPGRWGRGPALNTAGAWTAAETGN